VRLNQTFNPTSNSITLPFLTSAMSEPYNEQLDLDLVANYFSNLGLSAERFSHAETQTGKTPDFRIRQGGILVAYCEVKAPNDPWLDELLDNAPPLTCVGGARSDPIFNRLARLLNKADAQFAAVNSARDALNILAYVNHDDASNRNDLVEILTGYFHADGGTKHPTNLRIAEELIGEAKRRIDVFLWFEASIGRLTGMVFNEGDEERKLRLHALLGADNDKIQH
jgi:hypothetical protein